MSSLSLGAGYRKWLKCDACAPFLALFLVAGLTACGGSVVSAAGGAPNASSGKSSAASGQPSVATIGHGFTVTGASGGKYGVYLTKVVDPARGADSFTTPDSGKRFVGAVFTIKGVSGTTSDDADSNATLIGSNGQAYTADFDDIAGYTNFNSGEFNVSPGSVEIGAVTFQVPMGVKISQIQWSATGGFGGTPGKWNVG